MLLCILISTLYSYFVLFQVCPVHVTGSVYIPQMLYVFWYGVKFGDLLLKHFGNDVTLETLL